MVEALKGRLGESDKDVALLGGKDSESKKKVDELYEILKAETAKKEENGRAVECLEVRTSLFFISIFFLKQFSFCLFPPFTSTFFLRFLDFISFFHNLQNLLSSSHEETKALHATVAELNIKVTRLDSMNNATNQLKLHDKTNENSSIKSQNSYDSELLLKVSVLESFKSELQLENDRLNTNCNNKAQKVSELSKEIVSLRSELDGRLNDLDVLRNKSEKSLSSEEMVRKRRHFLFFYLFLYLLFYHYDDYYYLIIILL